jgi:hypothetical protein
LQQGLGLLRGSPDKRFQSAQTQAALLWFAHPASPALALGLAAIQPLGERFCISGNQVPTPQQVSHNRYKPHQDPQLLQVVLSKAAKTLEVFPKFDQKTILRAVIWTILQFLVT